MHQTEQFLTKLSTDSIETLKVEAELMSSNHLYALSVQLKRLEIL